MADKAMCALCTLELLNILKIGLTFKFIPITGEGLDSYYKVEVIVMCLILLAINSYLFLRKKKYLEIEKRFNKESKTQKLVGDIVVSLYALATVVSMFMV